MVVQPLTQADIEGVLQQGGASLAALRETLWENQELRDLATTPLMLSVLVLAYHGTTVHNLPQQQASLEQRVWTDYVERMVREKGAEKKGKSDIPVKRYSLEQTRSWLGWLAQQMRAHNQTLFYGESLLEGWLPASQQRAVIWLIGRFPAMVLGAVVSLLLSFFLESAANLGNAANPVRLCQAGLIGGFLGWCLCSVDQCEYLSAGARLSRWKNVLQVQGRRLLGAGSLAILVTASFGLDLNGQAFLVRDWVPDGIIFGGSLLPGAWLLQIVLPRLAPLPLLPCKFGDFDGRIWIITLADGS